MWEFITVIPVFIVMFGTAIIFGEHSIITLLVIVASPVWVIAWLDYLEHHHGD